MKAINRYGSAPFVNRLYFGVDLELLNQLHVSVIKNHILTGRMAGYNKFDTLLDITDIHYCSICSISKPRAYFLVCCFNTICADCFYELMARESFICPYCRYFIIDSAILLNIHTLEHIPTISNINLLYIMLIKAELLSTLNAGATLAATLGSYINVKQLNSSNSVDVYKDTGRPISAYYFPIISPSCAAGEIAESRLDSYIANHELGRYTRLNKELLGMPAIISAVTGGEIYSSGTVLIIHNNFDKVKFLLKYIGIRWADFSKIYRGGNSNLDRFRNFLSGKVMLLVINMEEIISEYPNAAKIDIYDTFSKHGGTAEFNTLLTKLPGVVARIINYNLIYVNTKTRWRYYDQLLRMLIGNMSRDGGDIEVINTSTVY